MVKLDGVEVGRVESLKELKSGASLTLPDGQVLMIKPGFHPMTLSPLPDLSINGVALPDSFSDPVLELRIASNSIIAGGILTCLIGLVSASEFPMACTSIYVAVGLTAPLVGLAIRRLSRNGLRLGMLYGVFVLFTFLLGAVSTSGIDLLEAVLGLVDAYLFTKGLRSGFKAIERIEKEGLRQI